MEVIQTSPNASLFEAGARLETGLLMRLRHSSSRLVIALLARQDPGQLQRDALGGRHLFLGSAERRCERRSPQRSGRTLVGVLLPAPKVYKHDTRKTHPSCSPFNNDLGGTKWSSKGS